VARLDALQSQINPHFLFNTLNSVSSLVRFDPDTARELIVKLASILRRLLNKHDAFVRLSEEVEFIDDYLDIEVVRFGSDKLKVEKELDPDTLDLLVPNMILQPLIENSLKHGLAPKVEGGTIVLRSQLVGDRLALQLEDDGVGMEASAEAQADPNRRPRIGLANVAERMHVLYGDAASLEIRRRSDGRPGTLISLEFPVLQTDPAIEPIAAARIYAERAARTRS
jgi:two-component system, LytTR family, sensor kinase